LNLTPLLRRSTFRPRHLSASPSVRFAPRHRASILAGSAPWLRRGRLPPPRSVPSGGAASRLLSAHLRDEDANPHPRAAPVVFHHLDGFLLLDLATVLQAAADPGVHHVSFCRETEFPAGHLLPFEAFPPPTATSTGTNPSLRGPASPCEAFSAPHVHREPCPLTLSPPKSIRERETAASFLGSRGLRALLHRRVRCSLDRFQPLALGAPLGLFDSPNPLAPPLGFPFLLAMALRSE
jgi:hypothetical protein